MCDLPHLPAGESLREAPHQESGEADDWKRRLLEAGIPGHSGSGSNAAAIWPPRSGPIQGPSSYTSVHCVSGTGPEVSKVRSLTGLCGLLVTVENYVSPKGLQQCKRCSTSATRSGTAGTGPGVSRVGARNSLGTAGPPGLASVLRLRGRPHGELSGLC